MKYQQPNKRGYFGDYGGRYVPLELEKALLTLEKTYFQLKKDAGFQRELSSMYRHYLGRPTMLYEAENLTRKYNGAKIFLKREDLNHTGAHKPNNTVGQALVARYLGKKKLIAETGAGQHGVAVATVAANFGFACDIYMGQRDIHNQKMNVYRMKLLGATVIPVKRGQQTLKDAIDVALEAYIKEPDSFYMLGSAVGPHPYPVMVRDFQSIIGREVKKQIITRAGRLPDYLIACVGGGSNALGLFYPFINDLKVKLIAVEPEGKGAHTLHHGLALSKGNPGIIHGFKCQVLQDKKGNIGESYSAASGLDYPGVGPELSFLHTIKRLSAVGITDTQAVKAFVDLSQTEGIIPALESAHAVAFATKLVPTLPKDQIIIVNLSGRGDKDVRNVVENLM